LSSTSRELVKKTLTFQSPERLPRHLWVLPWAENTYPEELKALNRDFPGDFDMCPDVYQPSPRQKGDPFTPGHYTDEWGCVFTNIHEGIIGEVREPQLKDIADWKSVKPPYETLPEDEAAARDKVNRFCAQSDKFVLMPRVARPWERLQFLRGTAESMMDLVTPDEGARDLLRVIHEYYMKEMQFWASTDVDALFFMDDWGSQQSLLISPKSWRELFKPLYKDYCDLAKASGKFIFMHSDGNIQQIYPDLVELGVSAVNSQLFTMDMARLEEEAKGKITFWGEIDRQHVLASRDPEVGREAVRKVARHLYDPSGGIIIQFEFGPGVNPAVARAVLEEWERVQAEGI
jgi:uroporphyrinogen decarboxylase